MKGLLSGAFHWARFTVLSLIAILIFGMISYLSLPREASPDIQIPTLVVTVTQDGISPTDGEKLIALPVERQLQGIAGLKSIQTKTQEGSVGFRLEFHSGTDMEQAKDDVKEELDIVESDLPEAAESATIKEINVSLFPVLSIGLSGNVSETVLVNEARNLERQIESLPDVLSVDIRGERPLQIDVSFSQESIEAYGLTLGEVLTQFQNNNKLIQAGAVYDERSQYRVKIPGILETESDVRKLPISMRDGRVIPLSEIAEIKTIFRPESPKASLNGEQALILEVTKRLGGNIIEAIDGAKSVVEDASTSWGGRIHVTYMQDESKKIRDMLGDLEANILTGVLFVAMVIMAFMGASRAVLVGLSIPFSFLISMIILEILGVSLNNIVLFGLILVLGLLVDGTVVTVELADRYLREGMSGKIAYMSAAKRMFWPIVSSTATTLAVFVPLLFWPGITGDFMSYLPLTVITVLSVSIVVALFVVPFLGGMLQSFARKQDKAPIQAPRMYKRTLASALDNPWKTLGVAAIVIVSIFMAYPKLSSGIEFFPSMEPDFLQVQIRARGTLSIAEKERVVRHVESKIKGVDGVKSYYARTHEVTGTDSVADQIGVIQIDLWDWNERESSSVIEKRLRHKVGDIPGIIVNVKQPQKGPGASSAVNLEVRGNDPDQLMQSVRKIQGIMAESGFFTNLNSNIPLPTADWELVIDRGRAAYHGIDLVTAGNWIQLVTRGIKLAELRPLQYADEIEVFGRLVGAERTMKDLASLMMTSASGERVMLSDIADLGPVYSTGTVRRIDGERSYVITSDMATGKNLAKALDYVKGKLESDPLPHGVSIVEKGDSERQNEAIQFLLKAFVVALVLMLGILLLQFNSFRQSTIVFSAVLLSMAGVLLGLMIMRSPFVIVMGGIGIISLAGIVVNNNIVLIDAFNEYLAKGLSAKHAALNSALDRFRPVMLTSITTVLGLAPMVAAITIDYAGHTIAFNAPSSQWWVGLSSTIAGGLVFVTLITLILTPVLLTLTFREKYAH